jgi:hypothetical protein
MDREHKVKCDYGMGDYHRYFKKHHDRTINRNTFSNVITDFNLALRDLIILENLSYTMPGINFQLVLRKEKRKPKIKDGKLLNNIPVDFQATKALWERDAEAKRKKLLVRYNNSHTSHYVFRIYFKKFGAKIKFRSVYKFQVNRDFKRSINTYIRDPELEVDAFLLYKNNYNV